MRRRHSREDKARARRDAAAAASRDAAAAARVDRVVEDAVRFIEQRAAEESLRFSMEVGEFLFRRLFMGDLALFRSNQPWKREAIARIARDGRVGLPESTLYSSVHVHLLVKRLGERHPDLPVPDIAPSTWSRMWDLYDEGDEALFAVLAWVSREKVPRDLVEDVVQTIGPYVEAGGKIADLLVGDPDEPPGTPFRRIERMLGVERKWLAGGAASRLSGETRRRAIEVLGEIEGRLG